MKSNNLRKVKLSYLAISLVLADYYEDLKGAKNFKCPGMRFDR